MHTVDALATLELPSKTISKLVSLPPPTASLRILWNHPSVAGFGRTAPEVPTRARCSGALRGTRGQLQAAVRGVAWDGSARSVPLTAPYERRGGRLYIPCILSL